MATKTHQRPTPILRFVYMPNNEEAYEIPIGLPKYTERRRKNRQLSSPENIPIIQPNTFSNPEFSSNSYSSPIVHDQAVPEFSEFVTDFTEATQPTQTFDIFQEVESTNQFDDCFQTFVDEQFYF